MTDTYDERSEAYRRGQSAAYLHAYHLVRRLAGRFPLGSADGAALSDLLNDLTAWSDEALDRANALGTARQEARTTAR